MPDPIVTSAAIVAGGYTAKAVISNVERVVGPSLDNIGEVWAERFFGERSNFQLKNLAAVARAAQRKGTNRDGAMPPRVAYKLLDEASYCDNELMAEYFGGLLAGSKTPDGQDDRAISWIATVAGMSASQIRAHYLIYRKFAILLHDRHDINLGFDEGRNRSKLYIDLQEFINAFDPERSYQSLCHAITGLVRFGLIGPEYGYGESSTSAPDSRFPTTIKVNPSMPGLELYSWAQGVPYPIIQQFITLAEPFDCDPPIPRLSNSYLPIPAPEPPTVEASL